MSLLFKRGRSGWWSLTLLCSFSGLGVSACGEAECSKTKSCMPEASGAGGSGALGGRAGGEGPESELPPLGGQAGRDTERDDGKNDQEEPSAAESEPRDVDAQSDCDAEDVSCDGVCINPSSDSRFCGASGDCSGSKAGERCEATEVCHLGRCEADCGENRVACQAGCIDPLTDEEFCGAMLDCTGRPNVGTRCSIEEECVQGACLAWREPQYLATSGGGSLKDLNATTNAAGAEVVYWSQYGASDSSSIELRYSTSPQGGGWSGPYHVPSPEGVDVSYPKLVFDQKGRGTLAYVATDDTRSVFVRDAEDSGKPTGESMRLDTGLDKARWLRTIVTAEGAYTALWIDKTDGISHLRLKTRRSNGLWLETQDLTAREGATIESPPQIGALPDGQVLVVWLEQTEGAKQIKWTSSPDAGAWSLPPNTFLSQKANGAGLRIAPGGAALVWSEGDQSTKLHFLARFDGEAWVQVGDPQDVPRGATTTDVTVLPNGDMMRYVVFADTLAVERYSVQERKWTQLEAPRLPGVGAISKLASGADDAGNVMVTFQQGRLDTVEAPSLWVSRFEASSQTWSSPRLIDARLGAVHTQRSLRVLPSGEAVLVWALEGDEGPRVARFGEAVLK